MADAIESVTGQVGAQFGPIDFCVHDAMTSVFSPIEEREPAEYKRLTELTYLGHVCGRSALKRMLPGDRGVVI